ncbi:MFS transporter [Sphingomonas sp.]|uniref:MFS transporter n=1 Tax=Sphingomonas sp. TaxID=28214 RepID=UPI001DE87446|nr:MFS transporter [Sphingomonas sp.]MBX9795928.1 MFS transporter [Sphingomonas sp.]
MTKPRQSAAGLWNISFGFFGIQIGFALQNANMSRIFQTLSPDDPDILNKLPALWVAAPLTGLLVQPVIGHFSDRTWLGALGRRRPYFLAGALLATLALFVMPLAPALLVAAFMLWVLDASLNISMEPFRAFVGDMLPKDQHASGYAVQTAFIGAGAVVGSLFPKLLELWGVANTAPPGAIPDTVRYAFWFGGACLFVAVGWTVLTTREYSPEEMARFERDGHDGGGDTIRLLAERTMGASIAWIAGGAVVAAAVRHFSFQQEMYLLAALMAAYGLASIIAIRGARAGRPPALLGSIVGDFSGMPQLMKRLALVQFFSWSALFIMWINTTAVVAEHAFGTTDAKSAAFQAAANWVDVLFATYNGVAAIAALTLLPMLARRIGAARTHVLGLLCGAAGYASFFLIRDAQWLLVSEVGIGIAWASILAMPYAILAASLPQAKLGVYMGLFNVFVVVPQLLVATLMGSIMKMWFPGQPIYTMAFASAVMLLAALAMLRVAAPAPTPAAQAV